MTRELRCHAVVVRSHGVYEALPWPHSLGALPSEEGRPDFVPPSLPEHPYRRGEFYRTIALTGSLDPLEVGTVMAAIVLYELGGDDEEETRRSIAAIVDALLAREGLVVGGGIEITLNGELVLTPECCCGLEKWREWLAFADGGPEPWGGHSPDPYLERLDADRLAMGYSRDEAIVVAPAELRAALESVERELAAFDKLLTVWAREHVGARAMALVDKLAHDFALRPPG